MRAFATTLHSANTLRGTVRELFLSRPSPRFSAALHFTVCSPGVAQNHFGCLDPTASRYQPLISPRPPDSSETVITCESQRKAFWRERHPPATWGMGGMSFWGHSALQHHCRERLQQSIFASASRRTRAMWKEEKVAGIYDSLVHTLKPLEIITVTVWATFHQLINVSD